MNKVRFNRELLYKGKRYLIVGSLFAIIEVTIYVVDENQTIIDEVTDDKFKEELLRIARSDFVNEFSLKTYDKELFFDISLSGEMVRITPNNIHSYFDDMQEEYHFPDVIFGIEDIDENEFRLSARADGYKGVWKKHVRYDEDRIKHYNEMFYLVIRFNYIQQTKGKIDSFIDNEKRFSKTEFYGAIGPLQRYLNSFILECDVTDFTTFKNTISRLMLKYFGRDDYSVYKYIKLAVEYISRLDIEIGREIKNELINKIN